MMNRIQFQKSLSLPDFMKHYGTERQCQQEFEKIRWSCGFCCPRCQATSYSRINTRKLPLYQCKECRHQTSLTANTVMQGSNLPLNIWFLVIYLISQSKTGLSALALKRQLGVSYPTAWLIQHKLMHAMAQRESCYRLEGEVQIDDAYFGGQRSGGKSGRGSENKVAFVAAVSMTERKYPLYAKLLPVKSFSSIAIRQWSAKALAPCCTVYSDGLACFSAIAAQGHVHKPIVTGNRKPKDMPEFNWVNTILGNLKTSFGGSYHAFNFKKYATRYLAAFCYRFNRRFYLKNLHQRLLTAAIFCTPIPEQMIRTAEDSC